MFVLRICFVAYCVLLFCDSFGSFVLNSNVDLNSNQFNTITFVRHGSTDWDWRDLPKGAIDLPVNQIGREHLLALSETLFSSGVLPRAIICSPLRRCKESAKIICQSYLEAQKRKIPILHSETLMGPSFGKIRAEELSRSLEIVEEVATLGLDSQESKKELLRRLQPFNWEEKERDEDFITRALEGLLEIMSLNLDPVIIVGHGSFCEACVKSLGLEVDPSFWKLQNRPPLTLSVNWSHNRILSANVSLM